MVTMLKARRRMTKDLVTQYSVGDAVALIADYLADHSEPYNPAERICASATLV